MKNKVAARAECGAVRKPSDRQLRGGRGPLGSEQEEERTRGRDVGSDPQWGGGLWGIKVEGGQHERRTSRRKGLCPEGSRDRGWPFCIFEHHVQILLF